MTEYVDNNICMELNPLLLIRTAKNISAIEMGQILNVSPQYICMLETKERLLSVKTLKEKLDLLGIDFNDYLELVHFLERLQNIEYPMYKKYPIALCKTLGIVYPELKKTADNIARVPQKSKKIYNSNKKH